MAQPATESRQYFLGVGGQQSGPHTEEDLLAKIQAGEVPRDALVWYDGLPEWQPIATVDYFSKGFEGTGMTGPQGPTGMTGETREFYAPQESQTQPEVEVVAEMPEDNPGAQPGFNNSMDIDASADDEPLAEVMQNPKGAGAAKPKAKQKPRTKFKSLARDPNESISSFASSSDNMEPIFKAERGPDEDSPLSKYKAQIVAGVSGLVLLAGVYYWWTQPSDAPKPHVRDIQATPPLERRQSEYQHAMSELMIKPDQSLTELRRLAKESTTDKPGKEALEAAINYYRQLRNYAEAGRVLMETKHPAEAAMYFLKTDPPSVAEAETAYFGAYEMAKGKSRQDALVEDIKILLGPLRNYTVAIERIKLLEKEFPATQHPFRYYLRSTDDRIRDIFFRTSFFFVQNLMAYLNTELGQLNLVKRPTVEIRRERDGRYRMVGTYIGEVILNKDHMPDIKFVFWYLKDTWVMVETNVTAERTRHAKAAREKHLSDSLSGDEMLRELESVFHTQFPDRGLHEMVSASQQVKPKRTEE